MVRGGGWLFWVMGLGALSHASSGCNDSAGSQDQPQGQAGASGNTAMNGGSGGILIVPMAGNGGNGNTSAGGRTSTPLVLCGDADEGGSSGDGGHSAMGGAAEAGGGAGGEPPTDDTCAPPPSRCANNTDLAYYSDGVCENGRCEWSTRIMRCPDLCSNDGCNYSFTAN